MKSAIELIELKKTYREGVWGKTRVGLTGVSFQVEQGEIFGFLGANGAGKTTAIKIALGLQKADAGAVKIFGDDSLSGDTKSRLGYLPERPYLHQNLTAQEFLNFHRSLHQKGRKGPSNKELLKQVGLVEAENVFLRNFSKGMLQRVGIAQALINDPELVIFDEPMSGLDPVGRREVRNLLVDLNRQGKTIFFSSHILIDIESVCNRIAFLEKGSLKYFGTIENLLQGKDREFEIVFRLAQDLTLPSGVSVIPMADWKKVLVSEKASKAIVEQIWTKGGEVKSFHPITKSLEDALFGRENG